MAKRGRPSHQHADYYKPKDKHYTKAHNKVKEERIIKAYESLAKLAGFELSWSYKERLKEDIQALEIF